MAHTIRDLQTYDEMVEVRHLQQKIWGFDDPNIGLYPPVLNTAAKNGGVVLGAFDDETGQMIGFIFSFLGQEPDGRFKLCSQNMGVLKEWRGRGVAEGLKQTQRQRVIDQGLALITWTFDPLEGPNAHLNLHKLGAISRRYWRNVYGSDFGDLNAGLPTDRLLVEWWVDGPRQYNEPDEEYEEAIWDSPSVFEIQGGGPARRIIRANLGLESNLLLLEIPANIQSVKETDMELAFDWRVKVRKAFESYFDKDYLAVGFVSAVERGERRNRYVLQQSTPELLAEIGIET